MFEHEVILVPMSVNNSFNTGIRHELNINFPIIKREEVSNMYGSRKKYGTIFEIRAYL